MKGTRPRAADPSADRAMADELAHSAKDKAENLMIVDLMRNDLSRVAEPGSVHVDAPFAVESYPTVHQMVTTVRARLAEEQGAMDLVRALFPCGSITGAPKVRAMELIGQVERDARGPYCGAIGRIDARGDAAFNVAIRTLRLTEIENGQGTAVLGVGSAIVADSDALPEWRESLLKADFARRAARDQLRDLERDPLIHHDEDAQHGQKAGDRACVVTGPQAVGHLVHRHVHFRSRLYASGVPGWPPGRAPI